MNKGFVVIAQNTDKINYVHCAEALAMSVKHVMPDANITLISDDVKTSKYFDEVVPLPYGDLATGSDWKLINDWQVYEASPYEYTIKLEADLYLPRSVDYWWDVLTPHDLIISSTIRNFQNEISTVRAYRRFIDDNHLPDTYNAITYFKKSDKAEHFFKLVKQIFNDWEEIKCNFKCNPEEKASTDFVYAIAAHVLGKENCTLPLFKDMSMIHMKQYINNLPSEDWTDIFVYEVLQDTLRVNTIPQMYPFHYHAKHFCEILLKEGESWTTKKNTY